MSDFNSNHISALLGQTIESIDGIDSYTDELIFTTLEGNVYKMYHFQDCCESVSLEDIIGDINDVIGSPILEAEEVSNADCPEDKKTTLYDDYVDEWTFYKLGTIKGHVTLRWYGTSNGYYSTSVSFIKK